MKMGTWLKIPGAIVRDASERGDFWKNPDGITPLPNEQFPVNENYMFAVGNTTYVGQRVPPDEQDKDKFLDVSSRFCGLVTTSWICNEMQTPHTNPFTRSFPKPSIIGVYVEKGGIDEIVRLDEKLSELYKQHINKE